MTKSEIATSKRRDRHSSPVKQTQLATSVASLTVESAELPIKKFKTLDESANRAAVQVLACSKSFNGKLKALLPILLEMQSFLSERGGMHGQPCNAEFPSWSQWFKTFQRTSGLADSLRTVQRRLKTFRGQDKEHQAKPSRP
jgi:hypothetical protein